MARAAELVCEANRYSKVKLVIGESATRKLKVGGVFKVGRPLALRRTCLPICVAASRAASVSCCCAQLSVPGKNRTEYLCGLLFRLRPWSQDTVFERCGS